MYVEGLAEEVDGSESFPSCKVLGKVWIETLQIDVDCGLSKQAQICNFFEQANSTQSYFK